MMTKNRGDKSELTSFRSEKATSKMVLAIYLGVLAPSGRHGMYSMLSRCVETLKPDSRAYYFDWMQLRYIYVAKTRATLLICNINDKHDTGSSERHCAGGI